MTGRKNLGAPVDGKQGGDGTGELLGLPNRKRLLAGAGNVQITRN
jgi:hypothetical protein